MKEEPIEVFRRAGREVLIFLVVVGALSGVLWIVVRILDLERTVEELEGFRAGIPATMLPSDRSPKSKVPATYRGRKASYWYYGSTASGTAANADYLVIVNEEGIVEAAFSIDREEGSAWLRDRPRR